MTGFARFIDRDCQKLHNTLFRNILNLNQIRNIIFKKYTNVQIMEICEIYEEI